MDTRLVELLPAALGLRNGDVKIIKNAGGVVTNPFGSVIRPLLVAIIELGVEEIMVIGHTDCGVQHIDSESTVSYTQLDVYKRQTQEVAPIADHWAKEGISFDAIYTGYLGSFEQILSLIHIWWSSAR